ncbi:Putative protein in type-1 retrotransposable element R1DM [Araneus ventricosus]|uniref:Uncharacterized protein n=1 Tax=Araneus ventricosus TaxID=182803 RepID=A0A4Y2A8C4_ARAVE|nr:Putative protein in type-1 retrotransposable element R1DM [Araneus ventricosus]
MEVNKQIEIKTTYAKMLEKNAPKPVTNISFKGAISKKVPPPGPSKFASESTTTNFAQSKIVNNARSKSTLPTLIIKPANEEIKTSAMLKIPLEGKIKLKDIQVEVLSCRPIQGNGIVVKTKTPEMLEKLKTTIMNDLTLRNKCQMYIPKPRVPSILLKFEEEIETIDSKQKLEKWIEELTITINQISQSFPRKVIKHLRVPWWDSELEVNRNKTRALRSRYQRCRREEERSMRRIVYKKQESHYKWLIKQKCRASFELFCQQLVANNAFDLPYKIAAGKIRKQTVLQSVKTSNGQFTNTIEETIQTIVQALFPTDDSTQETHVQRKKRETVNIYSSTILDKQFTKQEITYAISTMKKKKAPGIDGISIEIIKELHDMNPDILHYTYNKCLELGIFPETWKKGKLIFFNKPGKDPSLPNAYRPICLLSVLRKILDKLLVFRITHLLHKNNKLHKQQHGFRNGRSGETTNFRLWQAINIALQERVPVTLLSLDVQEFRADQVCGSMKSRHLKCLAHFGDPPDGNIDVRESVYLYIYKENIVREHLTGPQHYPYNGLVSGTRGEVSRNQEEEEVAIQLVRLP